MSNETPTRQLHDGQESAEQQHDPLRDADLDSVPHSIYTGLGLSREEVERHRQAPPAVQHGGAQAASAPHEDGPIGPSATGIPPAR